MPVAFITENLKTIRRAVGALMFDNMNYATIITLATSTASQAVAETFKRYQDGTFVGRSVYQVSSGEQRTIATHVMSTGLATWAPAFTAAVVGEELEIWPTEVSPVDVKDAINNAIKRVSRVFNVYLETANPTLDSTRTVVTLPSNFVKVAGVGYLLNGYWKDYRPAANDWLDPLGGPGYMLHGNKLYLSEAIESSAAGADIIVKGYRLPALLTADADVADVPSDYLTTMAAAILDLSEIGGASTDPENHEGRAANWLRDAAYLEARIVPNWHPSTQEVLV
jgi:hypothetical protein